jgi:hypothetical protein
VHAAALRARWGENWNVSPIDSPSFTGHGAELARPGVSLLRSMRVVALTGLGGVGKSQLAAQ